MLVIRPVRSSDVSFVTSSWINNQRGSAIASAMTLATWHRLYPPRVNRYVQWALEPANVNTIAVLTPHDEPDGIIGWAAKHDDVLDYVYVKGGARHVGNGRKLIASLGKLSKRSHDMPGLRLFFDRLDLPFDPYSFTEVS